RREVIGLSDRIDGVVEDHEVIEVRAAVDRRRPLDTVQGAVVAVENELIVACAAVDYGGGASRRADYGWDVGAGAGIDGQGVDGGVADRRHIWNSCGVEAAHVGGT